MGNRANPLITKLVMHQYEQLRKGHMVNLMDTNAARVYAAQAGFHELEQLIEKDLHSYLEIISRYKFYIKKYKMGVR